MIDSFKGDYYFLSNFYFVNISIYGLSFKSVESAYQASKSNDMNIRRMFENLNPSEAKKFGNTIILRKDWEYIKTNVMSGLVFQKFSNETLKQKLLETGDEELIEGNTWHDTFWGICDGVGENNLGKILMNIRSYFRRNLV